jgi:hypothetical protein
MNKTLGVIEKSIKNYGRVTSLLDTGKPMGEVGGNNTKIPFTEISRLLKKQEQALVNLQLYIQRYGARESKITGKWQRAK